MVDFLVAWMQALCILGLLCGAWYSITYRLEDDTTSPTRECDAVTTEPRYRDNGPVIHVRI